MDNKIDYIIVGQGLAGSAVAIHLLELGKSIMVFDALNKNSASRVAAGLFNPLTGRNMVKTWLVDETFSYLHNYYPHVESITGSKFFHPTGIYHPFPSVQAQNDWMARSSEPGLKDYIKSISIHPQKRGIRDEFGGASIQKGGFIDTNVYLNAVRSFLLEKGSLMEDRFDDSNLRVEDGLVAYGNFVANKVIFCNGTQSRESKWFGWVPVIPLKGETLTIKGGDLENQIVNRGVYMVPQKDGSYNVGATYELKDYTETNTEKGKAELIEKLKMVVDFEFEITGQNWGLRPTTRDRRPIIGRHPEHEQLIFFNGMGTKGVSISPYFAKVLTNWLENGDALNKEVRISRYKFVN